MAKTLPQQVPTPNTTPTSTELMYLVSDPYGTPADDAATAANVITKAHGLSDTTVIGVSSGVISAASTTGSGVVVRATSPALTTPTGIVKGDVGLGNVDNTSDATKNAASVTLTNKTISGSSNTITNIAESSITNLTSDLALKAPLASPTFTGTVTVPTTVNATDAAQKAYVDAAAQGLSVKGSVKLATAVALPANTYLSNVITITATGTLTIDGTVTALNDRLLVKDESSQLENGVYTVTTAGAVGVAAVLTRSTDMDVAAEFPGAFVFVESGTVNTAAGFVCTNSSPPTVGTTAITFTQFSGAGEITAGTGLSKSANTLSIDTAVTVDKTTVQTLTNKKLSDTTTTIVNASDATKVLKIDLSGATAAKTTTIASSQTVDRTITLPDATDTLVGKATTDTLTNKTLTSPVLNTGVSGTAVDTDGTMAANSDTILASQKAIKTALATKPTASLDTDGTLAANSDTVVASQKATKTYADTKVAKSTLTTKGDIYVATGSATVVRQGVGSDNQVLVADSAQTNGIKWASAPASNLTVTTQTTTYAILTTDNVVLCDTSGAAWTATLPTAVGVTGKVYYIKKTTSDVNKLTIATTSSQTIDGVTTLGIYTQYTTVTVVSDNANWNIL